MRIFALAALMFLTLATFAADWPAFHGPNANGISPEIDLNKDWNARPPTQLWKMPMTDGGYAGPSAAAGKVFIIDHQGNKDIVRAMELTTGKPEWTFEYQDAANSPSGYGFAQSTPVFDNGKLYTVSCMGQVHCLNANTGAKIWSCNLVADYGARMPNWYMAISPLIDGDKVILCPGAADGNVIALDKNTGKLLWKDGGTDKPGYATPVVATINGIKQYVVFSATGVNGVNAVDGKLLWSFPWRTPNDVNAALPLVSENFVFITSNYNRGCALLEITPDGPVKRWENKNMHAHFSSPIGLGGLIYGTSDPGRLVCLNPADGTTRWEQRGFEKGGMIAVDGTFIVLDGGNGDVAMVKISPDGYKELGRFKPLGGQSWTAPIVADGKLIIRNKATLACYNLK